MKVAVSGKGGSGKTTVSGTLARALATESYDVLAIDDDENPNLALTVGVPREQSVPPVPNDLLERVELPDGETELQLRESPQEVIDNHGTAAPDGVTLLKMGEVDHAGSGCMCRAHSTAREVLSGVVETRDEVTVMDMVAGVEHLGRGTTKDVDVLLVVVEPYYKSLETGRRTRDLAAELGIPDVKVVANKVRDESDRAAIEEFCANNDLSITAVVPYDDAVRHADQDGTAPYDYDPDAPAVTAVADLADDLLSTHA
ncbi:MAG: AAA family ATPase [Haloferacaceae archaeon]